MSEQAGRELDAVVAERVMGWERGSHERCVPYLTRLLHKPN